MKRVVIFVNGTDVNGKMFVVTCHSLEELLTAASAKFEISAKRIFTMQGDEVHDIKVIRSDDILYVSSGEDYVHYKDKSQNNEINKNSKWITLNVGGKYFTTTRDTLTKQEPTSMLARMFAGGADTENIIQPSEQDHLGAYFIDRSPLYFEPLLNYLRHGQMILDPNVNIAGVLVEAQFYGIEGAMRILSSMMEKATQGQKEKGNNDISMIRRDVSLITAMCAQQRRKV